jgi:hypothetical protein
LPANSCLGRTVCRYLWTGAWCTACGVMSGTAQCQHSCFSLKAAAREGSTQPQVQFLCLGSVAVCSSCSLLNHSTLPWSHRRCCLLPAELYGSRLHKQAPATYAARGPCLP